MYTYNNSNNEYSKLENTFEYQANIRVYQIFEHSSQHYQKFSYYLCDLHVDILLSACHPSLLPTCYYFTPSISHLSYASSIQKAVPYYLI